MWARPDTPGQYAFFNATVCPAGWVAADGANGTVDLRGEFVRGWDNGRGVDSGRALASWQMPTGISGYVHSDNLNSYVTGLAVMSSDVDGTGNSIPGSLAQTYVNAASYNGFFGGYNGTFTTRPRNVALLSCMKL